MFFPLRCSRCFVRISSSSLYFRRFTTFSVLLSKSGTPPVPPRKPIPESELVLNYLKGSGPGGQKINKTNSAVQIKHLPTGIVVKCQETRSRDQNEKIAMRKIQDKLEEMEKGEDSRVARKRELLIKRKASKTKKAKRKYRALEEAKDGTDEMTEVEPEREHSAVSDRIFEVQQSEMEADDRLKQAQGDQDTKI